MSGRVPATVIEARGAKPNQHATSQCEAHPRNVQSRGGFDANLPVLPAEGQVQPETKSSYRRGNQLSPQRGDRRPFLFRAGDDRGDPGGALFGRRTDVGSHLDSRRYTRRSNPATADRHDDEDDAGRQPHHRRRAGERLDLSLQPGPHGYDRIRPCLAAARAGEGLVRKSSRVSQDLPGEARNDKAELSALILGQTGVEISRHFPSGFRIFTSSAWMCSLPQITSPVFSGSSSPSMPETMPPASRTMIWPAAMSQACRLRSQ